MKLKSFMITAGLLFVTSTPVFADVYFSSRVTYYNVYGTSEYDLNRDFKEKRLASKINPDNTVIANTYLRFNSKLNHNGRCENSKVDVYVDITQTSPRWVDYNLGSLTLRAKWDEMINSAVSHEERHKSEGLEAAHKLDNFLNSINWNSNCNENERIRDKETRRIVAEHHRQEIEYDRKHGINPYANYWD